MKGYHEIKLMEVVEEAGGRTHLVMNEEPASALFRAQERVVARRLQEYREVGELHPETIWDYADAILEEARGEAEVG